MFFVCHPKILHKHCFQFLFGPFELPRETEDNAYAKFWGDKQTTWGDTQKKKQLHVSKWLFFQSKDRMSIEDPQ